MGREASIEHQDSPGKFPVFKDTDGGEFVAGFPSCAETTRKIGRATDFA